MKIIAIDRRPEKRTLEFPTPKDAEVFLWGMDVRNFIVAIVSPLGNVSIVDPIPANLSEFVSVCEILGNLKS